MHNVRMADYLHPANMTSDQRLNANLAMEERVARAYLKHGTAAQKATARRNLARIEAARKA